MQKLYKVAFQKILAKIGADQLTTLTVSNLTPLLTEKNIPLSQIDENLFHKLPREQLKNLVRNPCPINKGEQTSSNTVINAKAMRGSLNIVEKKICFRCPFVDKCDHAFVEPTPEFKIDQPLENLLISMKNIAENEENNDIIKNRAWFSGVRICDSLNSVMDDLLQGGEEFKTFKTYRNELKDEAGQKQKVQDLEKKQVLKSAKKMKIPLKHVYAQVSASKPNENNAQQEGEETFEQLTKGPGNIFKQKKGEEFIKIAQKYLNQESNQQQNQENYTQKSALRQKTSYKENTYSQKKVYSEGKPSKRQFRDDNERPSYNKPRKNFEQTPQRNFKNRQQSIRSDERGYERRNYNNRDQNVQSGERGYERRNYNNRDQNVQWGERGYERRNYNNRDQNVQSGERGYDRQRQRSFKKEEYDEKNYNRKGQSFNRQYDDKQKTPNRGYEQRKFSRNDEETQNPKIRRLSKENPRQYSNQAKDYQNQPKSYNSNNKLNKFYSEIKGEKSDQDEILSQLNKRSSPTKESKLPRDAKFNNNQNFQRGRNQKQFTNSEMDQFSKLQKIPKILKSQFASKQDLQDRIQQQNEGAQQAGERKGRKVRRL